MQKSIDLVRRCYILSEIRNVIDNINQKYNFNIDFDIKRQFEIVEISRACIEEITSMNHDVDEFVEIASLCNAITMFPFTSDKKINTEIIVSVLLEMTSRANDGISLEKCNEKIKDKIIEKIAKIQQNHRTSPYILGICLRNLYLENKHSKSKI